MVSKRLDQGLIFVVRRDIRVINDRWSEAIAKPKIYKNRQNVRSLLSRRKPRDKWKSVYEYHWRKSYRKYVPRYNDSFLHFFSRYFFPLFLIYLYSRSSVLRVLREIFWNANVHVYASIYSFNFNVNEGRTLIVLWVRRRFLTIDKRSTKRRRLAYITIDTFERVEFT